METNRYVWAWWNFVSCCRSDYTNILDSTYSHSRAQGSQNIPTNRETERTNIRFDGTSRKRNSLGRSTIRLVTQWVCISGVWLKTGESQLVTWYDVYNVIIVPSAIIAKSLTNPTIQTLHFGWFQVFTIRRCEICENLSVTSKISVYVIVRYFRLSEISESINPRKSLSFSKWVKLKPLRKIKGW